MPDERFLQRINGPAWVIVSHEGLGTSCDAAYRAAGAEVAAGSDADVTAALVALLRYDKYIARDFAPDFHPKFVVHDAQWARIRQRFSWLKPERVTLLPPATDSMLLEAMELPTKAEAERVYGRRWNSLRTMVGDAYLRPCLPVAQTAYRGFDSQKYLLTGRLREASREWLLEMWPELVAILDDLPPVGVRQEYLNFARRVAEAYKVSGRQATEYYASPKSLIKYCERLGVFKHGYGGRIRWGSVWKWGLTHPDL